MEEINYATAIAKLLDELEVMGYDRKKVAELAKYKPKTFATALKRGGNEKMLNKIEYVKQTIAQVQQNPDFEILDKVQQLETEMKVVRLMLADVLSKLYNRPAHIINAEYDKYREDLKG